MEKVKNFPLEYDNKSIMKHSEIDLEHRLRDELKSLPEIKRRRHIYRVYQQLVPGRNSKKRKKGEYKRRIEGDVPNMMGFLDYVGKLLREHHYQHQAKRLREFYSLHVPSKKHYDK